MCLATPVQIKRKTKNEKLKKVIVEGGKEVDISLVSDAKVGDWLLCHADLAVQKISDKQAKEVLSLQQHCHHHS